MNKLSKTAIVSSLSVLGGVMAFGGVVLAQDSTTATVESSDLETKESSQTNSTQPNLRLKNRSSERRSLSNKSNDISSQAGEKRSMATEENQSNASLKNISREQKIKDRCDIVGIRVVNHQSKFAIQSQTRITKYNQITVRLESLKTKLEEKGVDVITYNSYITELKSKITALNTLNQDYITLFQSKPYPSDFCRAKDSLYTEVETRKSNLQLIISQDKEIRMYIKYTILPYLRSIKPEGNNTESSSADTSNSSMTTVQ